MLNYIAKHQVIIVDTICESDEIYTNHYAIHHPPILNIIIVLVMVGEGPAT